LNQALKNLSARKTLDEGGYAALEGGQGSYRDILKNKKEAVSLEQENRVVKTEDTTERLIGEYETRLQTESDNFKLIRSLAELYTQKNQFDRALELYDRIKKLRNGQRRVARTRRRQTACAPVRPSTRATRPRRADHAEQSAKIHAAKLEFQMVEGQKRVEKYPTDLAIRFEMGELYFKAGKITEAIQEFKRRGAIRTSALRPWLSRAVLRQTQDVRPRRAHSAGRHQRKTRLDDEKKEMVYHLGCVFESMGKKAEAVEQFKLIYEMDIGYKDVAAKVDAFYAGQ